MSEVGLAWHEQEDEFIDAICREHVSVKPVV